MSNEAAIDSRAASASGRRWTPVRLALLAGFAVLMGAVCWGSIEIPRDLGRAAPFWPANAILLAVLLSTPRRRWLPWLASAFLGNFCADLLAGDGLVLSAVLTACNSIEVIVSAVVLRRLVGPRFDVAKIGDFVRFVGVAGVGAPLIAATLCSLAAGRLHDGASVARMLTWAGADGLGALIITPLLLGLRDLRGKPAITPLRPQAVLKLAVVGFATVISFQLKQPVFFLIPPAMLLAVFELETLGAALSVLMVLVTAVVFGAVGHTPWSGLNLSLAERLTMAQLFFAAITLTTFPTAAILSQRRNLKRALDRQYERVKLAEEIAGVGYWRIDLVTRACDWSDAVFKATGVARHVTPTADMCLDFIHAEDRPLIDQAVALARADGQEHMLEYRIVRAQGEVRHIFTKIRCEAQPDGAPLAVFGTMLDITDLRRTQQELVEREARYRMLADAATDIVLKVDAADVLLYASPSVRRYGYEPDDLLGRSGFSLVHPDDLAKLQGLIADLFSGREVDTSADRTYRVRTASGDYVWMEGNPAIIRGAAGEPVAVVSQLRDVTARRAMEDELRAARAAAEAAAAVKSEFLANMSHELRTPLTAVIGFTRLALEQPDLSEATRRDIGKAAFAGEALLTTVNDILDFSKLEAGRMQIRPEPCDADQVCRSALALFSAAADAKGVTLRYATDGLPEQLRLDPARLRQILLNLVGNAVKFSDAGEVLVHAAWRPEDSRLVVSISDDGPGIGADQQDLLFRRFSQVDGSSTRRHGGTGLGLAICQGLVDAMAGAIGVESELGQGARFWFELPAEACKGEVGAKVEIVETVTPGTRVLVADDHQFNRELVRAVLTQFGAQVTEACDGAEAVEAAKGGEFDIILMDLRMPRLDGLAAMQAIRAGRGPNRTTPILAFSAGADEPGSEERRAAGFDGDLAKPLLPAALVAAVCAYAGQTHVAPAKPRKRASKRQT